METQTLMMPKRAPGKNAAKNAATDLVRDFLARYASRTRQEYQADLQDFARFMNSTSLDQAAHQLLAQAPGQANHIALKYRNFRLEAGLSAATVNRRLTAVRSLVKLARRLGLVSWFLEVDYCRVESLRDTRGPGIQAVREILAQLKTRGDIKGIRDVALVRLMADLGLRVSEAVGLDVEHVDLVRGVIMVLGKGKTQRQPLTLPPATCNALGQWLEVRAKVAGDFSGPLFCNLSRAHDCTRLTARAVGYLLGPFGTRPHGLRHTAVTTLLDKSNGNITMAQKFARHASPKTTIRYNDNLRDVAGEAALLISMEW